MKKWIILIALLGAGLVGYYAWNQQRARRAEASSARPATAMVIQTNISFAVNAAGEITPAEQVSVRPEINGKIELLPVDVGDRAGAGDILFKLDDKELQQQRASNLTDVERAKLDLEKGERDYKRAKELLAEKLISQELYDNTRTIHELAKVALDRSQKDLAIIDERLTKTEVRAPFACTILTRPVSMGQAVSGSGGCNSGTEVLTIADLNSMDMNAHVNQADVPRLIAGQAVEVSIEAVAGLRVTGVVERIAPQATIKNNIKGFASRILLKNVDPRVRPGMTANVKIPVASAEHVQAVPLAAVYTEKNPETGLMERFVYVQQGDSFEKRNVKVGVSDYFFAEIQEGLSPGEIVALELPKNQREKDAQPRGGERADRGAAGAPSGAGATAATTNAGNRAAALTPPRAGATGSTTDQRVTR